jgi:hypothetical protein
MTKQHPALYPLKKWSKDGFEVKFPKLTLADARERLDHPGPYAFVLSKGGTLYVCNLTKPNGYAAFLFLMETRPLRERELALPYQYAWFDHTKKRGEQLVICTHEKLLTYAHNYVMAQRIV